MAQPSEQIMILSELHLNQALGQIRHISTFDGSTRELASFVRRVDFVMSLYPTTDKRQHSVLYSAIERQLSQHAQEVSQLQQCNTWAELRSVLIDEFKTQIPYEELLRRLYNTYWSGSIRKFVEELENKMFEISSKLSLENNYTNTTLYTAAMANTIKDVIYKRIPDRMFMTLARYDITTTTLLRQVAQREGLYDTIVLNTEKAKAKLNSPSTPQSSSKNNDSQKNKGNNNDQGIKPYYIQAQQSQNRNNYTSNNSKKVESNQATYNEFKQKLEQGRAQNALNFQKPTSYSTTNQPQKRQRESSSGQSKMDTSENFHQLASGSESEVEEEHTPSYK